MKEKIIIKESKIENNKLTNELVIPSGLQKYFTASQFYATYGESLKSPESISVIPALSAVLPIAWATNTDVSVKELDKQYFSSIAIIKKQYKILYPNVPFSQIIYDNLVENKINSDKTAALFTGGIDSVYTLSELLRQNKNPRLITLFRFTHRLSQKEFFDSLHKYYRDWASKNGLIFNVVDTNIRDILGWGPIQDFNKLVGLQHGLWNGLQQSLILISSTAPLSFQNFKHLFFGATAYGGAYNDKKTHASSIPSINNHLTWADSTTTEHAFVPKFQKYSAVFDFAQEKKLKLHSCIRHDTYGGGKLNSWNCCRCEKCARIIVGMLSEERDPRTYGYNINPAHLAFIKNKIIQNKYMAYWNMYWARMPKLVPLVIKNDYCGSKKFLEWFRDYRK